MPGFVCVGAAHWDLIGHAAAPLPRGADVPGRIEERPGGVALNIALALAARGHAVALLAAAGRDAAGDRLVAHLEARGVDCAGVFRHDGPTDRYLAIEDGGGELHAAVADCAGLEAAGPGLLAPLHDGRLTGRVVLDGNLPAPVLAALLAAPPEVPFAAVPASPGKAARLAPLLAAGRASFYLNRREAEALCRASFADARAAAAGLRARGAGEAIVTDGAAPVALASAAGIWTAAPPPVAARSLTGAGDALAAANLAAQADGLDAEAALRAALAASARHIARAL
jgi:sugar/nucleoside kinase (ribokinase family)